MPRDIFSDVARPRVAQRAWYTLPLSILAHGALVAIIIVVPLMMADALPTPSQSIVWAMPAAPAPPPPPPPPGPQQPAQQAANSAEDSAAPVNPPDRIGEEKPSGPPPVPGIEGGVRRFEGIEGGEALNVSAPPPPPPIPTPKETKILRPGGLIKFPQKVHDVRPIYPQIAVASRYDGRVIIEAVIATDGTVRDARVISSRPLLDQAALDAVRQWRFTPSTLNGVPVPVLLTITVDFKLQ